MKYLIVLVLCFTFIHQVLGQTDINETYINPAKVLFADEEYQDAIDKLDELKKVNIKPTLDQEIQINCLKAKCFYELGQYAIAKDIVVNLEKQATSTKNNKYLLELGAYLTDIKDDDLPKADLTKNLTLFQDTKFVEDCIKGNCQDGWGVIYDGDMLYEGFFKDGEPYYFGAIFDYEGGGFYIGQLNDELDEDNAQGIFIEKSGEKIEYKAGKPNWGGETGCVCGDCENGWGVKIYESGGMHAGYWKNGEEHYFGAHFWATGDFYMGLYNNGDRKTNAQGIYVWADKTYKVNNGNPKFTETNCVYGDCEESFGIYNWSSGDIHIGLWENGEQEYFSMKFWEDGDFFYGIYKDGDRYKWGFYVYEDGSIDVRTEPVEF